VAARMSPPEQPCRKVGDIWIMYPACLISLEYYGKLMDVKGI
jgi:hypothetical protein